MRVCRASSHQRSRAVRLSGSAERFGVFGARQVAAANAVEGQFGDDDVGRDAGQVEQQPLYAEAARTGLGQPVLDVVEIAVVHVDAPVADGQPGAAVEHAAAPSADLGDLPRPPEGTQAAGVEGAAVVDGKVPVTVRTVCPGGPRSAQRDRPYVRQRPKPIRDVGEKVLVVAHGCEPGRNGRHAFRERGASCAARRIPPLGG
jgi:hypothetical protein